MPIIKRYPNRKLYNTEAKQYITLDGIAGLIRDGQDVQVIDNVSGEDLTAVTFSQIIFEQEKKQGGFLPQSVLTGLIQAGGTKLDALRRTLMSPLDMLRQVDVEIERRVQLLVNKGELARDEAQQLRDKLLATSNDVIADDELENLLQKHGIPTRHDVEEIMAQLDTLSTKLEALSEERSPTE